MRLPDRVDGVAAQITDVSVFVISIALSCCFAVVLVAMGLKFPWFRRQLRLGSMAQMTATVNANAKKENAATATNVPSQGFFKRWEDDEAGPPPVPVRVTLRKDRPAPQPPGQTAPRSLSLPPASRKNNAEVSARKSEVPVRAEKVERSSAKETSSAKARKAEEERLKEERRQEVLRKRMEEKRKSSKKDIKRKSEPVVIQVASKVEDTVDQAPGPSAQVPQLPPKAKQLEERTSVPPPASAMVVSGTEVKGKKDKKKKKKAEKSAPPTRRNYNVPSNPMARRPSGQPQPLVVKQMPRSPSPPPAATNAIIFQKMNGVSPVIKEPESPEALNLSLPVPPELIVPRSPRPVIKSQARPRLPPKKKAPLGRPVAPPRVFTPPSTPPPGYEEQAPPLPKNLPPMPNITYESDGILSFRLPDAMEPLEVHPSFLALVRDDSDECDA